MAGTSLGARMPQSLASTPAPQRRYLAHNVIALWPQDRPPVANPTRRGRYPRGVLPLRRVVRLRPGVFAYLWNNCLPENRGVVVQLLALATDHELPGVWIVRGITATLAQGPVGGGTRDPDPVRRVPEGFAQDVNLRRCPAPRMSTTIGGAA